MSNQPLAFSYEKQSTLRLVKAIFARYQGAKAVEISIEKRVTLALLEEEKLSNGTLLLSKGMMRLEFTVPESSVVVVDKNVIWVETTAPKELGGKVQVLKIRSNEFHKQSKSPIAMLFRQSKIWDEFVIKSESNTDGEFKQLTLVPKKKGSMGEISSIDLQLDIKKKQIQSLGYKDDLENNTRFDFKNVNFEAKLSASRTKYSPPKNAEITEY